MTVQEMQEKINAMPAGQTFRMEDIVGEGNHDPGLWMHLCKMDDGKHYRDDGCLFVASQGRVRFRWEQPVEAKNIIPIAWGVDEDA